MTDTTSPNQRALLPYGGKNAPFQPQTLEFEHSLAVVIGINKYRHVPPLKTAARDAEELARILRDDYGYTVQLLTQDVTLERLKALLASLGDMVGPDDRVVFYFAGHGIALEGDDGPAGFLVPQDGRPEDRATFLRMDAFHDALMALECRHMLIILDCCFAGAMRWSSTRALQVLPEVIHQERYERFIRDPAWQVITSAAYDQKALDVLAGDVVGARGDAPSGEHSPFALALFEALRGAGDVVPAGGGDGVITAAELYLYLRDYVEVKAQAEAGHYQTPGLWPLKKHGKGEYIFLTPGHELNLPPAPELTFDNNPYRGLQAFEEEHAKLFFGRTALVEQLAEAVARQPLTVVLGASGTGKSSVVKAGLVPRLGGTEQADLTTDGAPGEKDWFILPAMRPTESPLRELAHLLHRHLPTFSLASAGEELHAPPRLLADSVAGWGRAHPDQKLLLVIDQFEELITLCRDDQEREQFLDILHVALYALPEQLRLVLTLRSDFEPQFAETALSALWKVARFVVPPMSQAELREAIEGPASVRVLYFEPASLIDRLIDEVIQTPGALPLLSFTLSELYIKYVERQDGDRALRQADYEALGGVVGSLRNRATEEYAKLDAAHQATMERIMLRMVASEGGELARRRVPRAELVYPDEAENARVVTVIQRLTEARLVVSGKTEEGVAYVEPAHDALVRAWDKLLAWHREAEEYLPLQRRLTQAAGEWAAETTERTKTDLLWSNDPRLPQVEQALAGNPEPVKRNWVAQQWLRFRDLWRATPLLVAEGHWLNELELDFVQRSVEQRRKEARRLVGIVTSVLLILTTLVIFSLVQLNQANIAREAQAIEIVQREDAQTAQAEEIVLRSTAEANAINAGATAVAERDIAISRQLAAQAVNQIQDDNWELGMLLAIEAGLVTETVEAFAVLQDAFAYPVHTVFIHFGNYVDADKGDGTAWWIADGRLALFKNTDVNLLEVWDTINKTLQASFPISGDVAWWWSDTQIATTSSNDTLTVWDITDGTLQADLHISGELTDVAFKPDGKHILTIDDKGSMYVWNIQTTHRTQIPFHSKNVWEAAWNADGSHILIVGCDATAIIPCDTQIWILDTQQWEVQYTTREIGVVTTWSSDGNRIIMAGSEAQTKIWDRLTNQEILLPIQSNWWDRTGSRFLTVGSYPDYTIEVWDATKQTAIFNLVGHNRGIQSATWGIDGCHLLTTNGRQEVWSWDCSNAAPTGVTTITGTHWTTLPEYYSTSSYATAWDTNSPRILIAGCEQWSPRADGCLGSSARVLDISSALNTGVETGTDFPTFFSNPDSAHVNWNAKGDRLLIVEDNTLQIRDAMTGDVLHRHTLSETIKQATLSADNNRILIATSNKTSVWDIQTEKDLFVLPSQENQFQYAAKWNKNESRIMTVSGGSVQVWNAEKQNLLFVLPGINIMQASWNKDEAFILTTDWDNQAQVWNAITGEWVLDIPVPAEQKLSQAEWDDDGSHILIVSCEREVMSGRCLQRGETKVWKILPVQKLVMETGVSLSLFPSWINLEMARWNADGSRILTVHDKNEIQIWDAQTGKEVLSLPGTWAEWDAQSDRMLTVTPRGVQVWDLEPGATAAKELFTLVGSALNDIEHAMWSPQGDRILTIHKDGAIRQYYTLMIDWLETACKRASRNMTLEEWQRFMVDEPYRKTCPTLPIHPSFIETGRDLARDGDIEDAVAIFQRALELNPEFELEPEEAACRFAALGLAEEGKQDLQVDIESAIAAYVQAQALDSNVVITAWDWRNLCWYGSLEGHAEEMIYACEKAVKLDPDNAQYRESRGVARTLTGDPVGAIEDFEFYVAWLKETGQYDPDRHKHETWIDALAGGRNPFSDEETLEELRDPYR